MTKSSRIAVMIAVVVLAVLIAARLMFPLQLYEATKHFDMWRHGVRRFHAQDMSGELRDHCDAMDPEARGCVCIALLHGLGDEPASWSKLLEAPKNAWVKPVKLYAPQIVRNQRFVPGDSSEAYRVKNQAAQIEQALAPLCPSWVMVGNSLGAWEAAWIALDGKLKVSKLIFIDGIGIRDSNMADSERLFVNPDVTMMHELLSRIYFKLPHLPDQAWASAAKMTDNAHLGDVLHAQTEADLLDGRLGTLRIPTMVLWGAGDRLVPDSVGKEVHAQIPGSIWREIPECGHVPQKECPIPVIQAIDDMLRVGNM